jgi:hypothetical protein
LKPVDTPGETLVLSGRAEESVADDFAGTRALVEAAIRTLGVEPSVALAKEAGGQASWSLQRGSAAILISLASRDSGHGGKVGVYLRVISPVMTLPPPDKREALFRHLLELNAQGLANAAFGVVGERVVAVAERPTEDMQGEEVTQMVRHLAAVADTYDDRLVKAFGGELASGVKSGSKA